MINKIMLKQIHILSELDDSILQKIALNIQSKSVVRNEYVFQKDDRSADLVFLFSGRLQVVDLNDDGNMISLGFVETGGHIGELAVIDNQPRSAFILAAEDSTVFILPQRYALELLTHYPSVALNVMRRLAHMIRTDNTVRVIMSIPNAKLRVYRYFITLAHEESDCFVIDQLPKHNVLASICNTSRETVSRAISDLVKRGIASKEPYNRLRISKKLFKAYADSFDV